MIRNIVVAFLALAAALILPLTASSISASPKPPGLSRYGSTVWNFEALARAVYRTSSVCMATNGHGVPSFNWTLAACSRPNAYRVTYFPVFASPSNSAFTRTTANPPLLGNVAPYKLGGEYIRCADHGWLAENNEGAMLCATSS